MEPIAIVGAACRFPGAGNLEELWRLLREGRDAVTEVPAERWDVASLYDPDPEVPGRMHTRWGGFLERVDGFDAEFFGISPREAARIDPQQRLLLEVAWEALEDAGQVLEKLAASATGVFVGISTQDYGRLQLLQPQLIDGYTGTGSAASIAANRLSWTFDLRGPSLAVDTACSSSLVAVHLACESLRRGESDLCLAGGVNLLLAPELSIALAKARLLAADGRCKAFDARADGYCRGEGCGVVVLKRYTEARRDGDPVRALILGTAVNQDGRSKGLTSPSGPAQEALLRQALSGAGVAPDEVGYVEAFGTGTSLGDAIEALALGSVLAEGRPADNRCALGSVKTNIGHLEAAAGIAGLLKAALAIERQEIPPSLHFEQPNPLIPFSTLPLAVPRRPQEWPAAARRIAGVSAFGFGGTNAHVVLAEAPAPPLRDGAAAPAVRSCLLPLSARSAPALRAQAAVWRGFLESPAAGAVRLADLAYSAAVRRTHHEHRLTVVGSTARQIAERLSAYLDGAASPWISSGRRHPNRRPRLALLLPGSLPAAGAPEERALWREEPAFHAALEPWDEAVRRQAGWSLLAALARPARWAGLRRRRDRAAAVLVALQGALIGLWRAWGVRPDAFIGQGTGALSAAWAAGALDLDAAVEGALGAALAGLALRAPEVPFFPVMDEDEEGEGEDPAAPRRLDEVVAELAAQGYGTFLEAGLPAAGPGGRDGLLAALGQLHASGHGVAWHAVQATDGRCVALPSYPWQRQRHWLDAPAPAPPPAPAPALPQPVRPAPPSGRVGRIQELVATVLGFPPGDLPDPERPLIELGLDSLAALELQNRLETAFGCSLPAAEIFGLASIAAIAGATASAGTAGTAEADRIGRREGAEPLCPASFAQERLWFLDQLQPGDPAFHIPVLLRLRGPLRPALLAAALGEVVRRHETLRTTFTARDGRPLQRIAPALPSRLPAIDLAGLPPVWKQAELERLAAAEAGAPFDLARGPLVRSALVRLAADEHALLMTLHHTVADGWSLGILGRELAQLYAALPIGPTPLDEPPVQYADFALWQRRRLRGERLEHLLAYWRRQLAGPPDGVSLPLDRPRPAVASSCAAHCSSALSPGLAQDLRSLGVEHGATPFMTLLAGFVALVFRYSGRRDVVVGTPVASRNPAEVEGLIGLFVNSLALRCRVRGSASFGELLRQVRQVVLDAFAHQELPFERLLAELGPEREPGQTPLFQLWVNQLPTGGRFQAGELDIEIEAAAEPGARFDVTLYLSAGAGGSGLELLWLYRTDLLDAATIARAAGHLQVLLASAVADPGAPVAALPVLTEGEAGQLAAAVPGRSFTLHREERGAPPANPVEEALARIWSDVLDIGPVGRHDDFFELGGHSLLALQVLSRIRRTFQVELPLRRLFEAPTVAALARHIEAAAREAREAIVPAVEPSPLPGETPLSFAQERLWFLDRLAEGRAAHHVAGAVLLLGGLEVRPLRRALDALLHRHEILRASFPDDMGRPRQEIALSVPLDLPLVDLSGLAGERRGEEERLLLLAAAQRPFDLARGPLLRSLLLRRDRDQHVQVLVLHHLVSDAWSLDVLQRDLSALYGAELTGEPAGLPELPTRYADYAAWQRRRAREGGFAGGIAYWRQRLADLPADSGLPVDHAAAPAGRRPGSRTALLDAGACRAVEALSARHEATLFMTLLAAMATLLYRYTGCTDAGVGTPVAGRDRVELEGVVGPLVNTLVLRVETAGDPSFAELLGRARECALGAYAHQDVPFELLLDDLRPQRDPERTPWNQAWLNRLPDVRERLEMAGLEARPLSLPHLAARFDLALYVQQMAGALRLDWVYRTDRFEPCTIQRLAEHFTTLLIGAAADPRRRLADLPLLDAAQRHQLVVEVNDTAAELSRRTVPDLFASWVERTPDSAALAFGDQMLTYGALARRVAAWAGVLRVAGVGPDVPVALCAERSPELVVGLLAILAGGGAFVAFDPDLPPERTAAMCADTAPRVLLTQDRLRRRLPRFEGEVLCLDGAAAPAAAPPRRDVWPGSLAYIAFTSGSTGRPKGIPVEHQSVVNHLGFLIRTHQLEPEDVVLQVAGIAFDAAMRDLIGPLCAGASVVLPSPDEAATPTALAALLRRHGVTRILSMVPSFLRHFLAELEATDATALRTLLLSGENLLASDVEQARRLLGPGVALANQYGPTECTMISSWHPVAEPEPERPTLPVGGPITNARLYLLDDALQPVPVSAEGELYIGGAGLARGYVGRPAATAESFLPDPFAGTPGARMYRTGDLARHLGPGLNAGFELRGRRDHQVKIRGHRVEPGEVEAALAACDGVMQCAVVSRDDETGGPSLVAFVVPRQGRPAAAETWRGALAERLPSAMIPARFVSVESLPRTATGKVDRKALAQVAAALRGPGAGKAASPLVTFRSSGRREPFFCVHGIGGSALAFRDLARALGGDQPFYGLQQDLDAAPAASLEILADRHLTAVRERQPRGPYRLGGWSFGGLVAFEMACRLIRQGQTVASLVLLDARPPGSDPHARPAPDADLLSFLLERDEELLPRHLEQRLSLYRAHQEAARRYRPGIYPGRLTLLCARDPLGPGEREEHHCGAGWSAHTAVPPVVLEVPGDHFSMLREPHVRRLAEVLRRVLDREDGDGPPAPDAASPALATAHFDS